jgi:ABC-type transport system involved in cytochrome c biogenesis permease subunit
MNIFDKLANPGRFQRITAPVMPYCLLLAGLSFAAGLYYALFASPADYQQGETGLRFPAILALASVRFFFLSGGIHSQILRPALLPLLAVGLPG